MIRAYVVVCERKQIDGVGLNNARIESSRFAKGSICFGMTANLGVMRGQVLNPSELESFRQLGVVVSDAPLQFDTA